jgi:hypothetical protein
MGTKRDDIMLMYLDWARRDVERGFVLEARFARELERWGRLHTDELDRVNAIGLIQMLEDEGTHGDEKFAETARKLGRVTKNGDPNERLIRLWWEERKEPTLRRTQTGEKRPRYVQPLDEKRGARKAGRPKATSRK